LWHLNATLQQTNKKRNFCEKLLNKRSAKSVSDFNDHVKLNVAKKKEVEGNFKKQKKQTTFTRLFA
jgi:hypothetical protein